ncbi:MAG: sensor histidine kinase [Elainellaceae cyanobacterium]
MLRQPSFRRILLFRILLLSVPVLLIGLAVVFKKARSSLLYTARQNLTESAQRKAENVQNSVQALKTNLLTASQTSALQAASVDISQAFLERLEPELPTDVTCLQLTDWQTQTIVASTCGTQLIDFPLVPDWAQTGDFSEGDRYQVYPVLSPTSQQSEQSELQSQLDLVVSIPVYDKSQQLRYVLSAQAVLRQLESGEAGSLLGYTVILRDDGTFLAHPLANRVGKNIRDEKGDERFQNIMNSALRGEQDVRHLLFLGNNTEWLAGYTPLSISLTPSDEQTWVVLAVTRLDSALHGLQDIKRILVVSTTSLLAALLAGMLIMARDLARPIEQLGKYARQIQDRGPLEKTPKNFRIREINQLAEVLDKMVKSLEDRARELESAWQEAETANQLKNEFLANTSHELRTPLNAIIGCIRLVRDDCCDGHEEEMEFLERADEAAVHLLKIINDLLDIAKIEAGTVSLAMEPVDLQQILREVIDLQAVQIHQKGLKLNAIDLPDAITVKADPAKLKQVFLNVIYNAIKFTDQGGITIDARIETAALPPATISGSHGYSSDSPPSLHPSNAFDSWIVVSVQDTGIGIDPTQQHKLFRPFVMVDGSTTRKFEGTGLGLAISRNLIELMGGGISLHSAGIGQGTTVEIALPISDVPSSGLSSLDTPRSASISR